jgi:hypothetical protein
MTVNKPRWLRPRTGIAALGATLVSPVSSWACPSCPIGQLARQQVCELGLAQNLLIAVVPFVLIGAAAAWAERIGKHPPSV